MTRIASLTALAVLAGLTAAAAQAPPQVATPRTAPTNPDRPTHNCAPTQAVPGEGTVAPQGATTGQAGQLSDRLARSDGVLCPPPGIDAEMHAPTPDAGKTPVIPPPGSPGGDPSVRPK
jgi:hypothetical protein